MVDVLSRQVVEMKERLLTAGEFQSLADVPSEVEWFANIENEDTRRASHTAGNHSLTMSAFV